MTLFQDETDSPATADCPAAKIHLSRILEMPPEYPDEEEASYLLPCSVCCRTFSPTVLQRHEKVCEKVHTKKRRIFDSTKQRKEGLDIPPSGLSFSDNKVEKKKKSRWREKHQEFLRTIRAAKGSGHDLGEGGDGESCRLIPSDYVQCPNCERHFGPKAADRHITWCEEQKNRLPRSYTSEDTEAIQRLKTRTKYAPPKPGQSGWRAPKKKDVISSIPPTNVGANITPPGRLISPPPPAQRQSSPPPIPRLNYTHRHSSPPPISPPRKGYSGSLPPGRPRYSTASLGRNAGKQFSAMLHSVTGCSPGYGVSSGYGSNFLYGTSPAPSQPPTFTRSASLRLPRRRPTGAGKMARHRDLASDMLASVTLGGKAKREEPEGDEDSSIYPYFERPSKIENATTYDPFSAAELQFQDLLGPSKCGSQVYSMPCFTGSTLSLKNLELRKFSPERNLSIKPKNRSTNLLGGASLSLCSLGNDYYNMDSSHLNPQGGDDSSELESLEHSPRALHSPDSGRNDFITSFSPSGCMQSVSGVGPLQSGSIHNRRSQSVSSSSPSNKSRSGEKSIRKHPEGSCSWRKSPSPPFSCHLETVRHSKDRSVSPLTVERSEGLQQNDYSRHFGDKNYRESSSSTGSRNECHPFSSLPCDDSMKSLRSTLDEELQFQKKTIESFEEKSPVASSSSSIDSSLPHLSSSPSSVSPSRISKSSFAVQSSSFPTFCYECGNKYSMVVAKFCCHCGAKRLAEAE